MTDTGKIVSFVFITIILLAGLASYCCQPAAQPPPEALPQAEQPQARKVFSSFSIGVYALCDQGHLIYVATGQGKAIAVVEGGCR